MSPFMDVRRNRHILSLSYTSLMLACQQESIEDVKNLLERQPNNALQRDGTGKNALHYCAENVNGECAGRVLSIAPELLNEPDDEGYTPLHLAVISSNKPMVKYLLIKGADPKAVDCEKHSCVHWAIVSGDAECLDLLIAAGADPSTPDMHGAYPVHYAAQMCGPNSEMGNDVKAGLAVLRTLLAHGVDVACVDRDQRPPLLWAASGGSSDAILALVKSGADVNAVDRDGLTALHCAASRGHMECIETLITLCGAEVDKVDESGCSALFYAVTLGHADCTHLLLSYGSQRNRQDLKGRSSAHCGAAKGQLETLKILSQHGANLWLRNSKGDMPLHEAVQSGRKELVEWFLTKHQSSVNDSNANGRTPLHIAALTNNVDMCKVLMDYGAFINPIMKNSKGNNLTPLDAALHRGNRSCAKYLSLHGALPASKILEMNEDSQPVDLSPRTRWRLLRDSSAQTEPQMRDVVVQAAVEKKTVSSSAHFGDPSQTSRIPKSYPYPITRSNKPIVAKVYVHTKRTKTKRLNRKSSAFKKDYQGEKILTSEQPQSIGVNFQCSDYRASNSNKTDTETPQQTDHEKDIPSRKASQAYEDLFDPVPEEAVVVEEPTEEEKEDAPEGSADEQEEQKCDCYGSHDAGFCECDCSCHRDQSQLLNVKERRRSSFVMRDFDFMNQSPLSSIRSLESTIKDSGFSDDVEHGRLVSSSDDGGHSDAEGKYRRRRRKKSHIARYIMSSGAAETFRLEEDDEGEDEKVMSKPRSSSLPHLRKKDDDFIICPRILNRSTLTKEIQNSLKKYQMERRLFYELQELKRKQITTCPGEETEVVIKIVERFRNHVLSPFLSDFQGPNTFRAFEKHLYEQLRKLSMCGKIPKPKISVRESERSYLAPTSRRDSRLCMCRIHNCTHNAHIFQTEKPFKRKDSSGIPTLPNITDKHSNHEQEPQFKSSINRSKSWDRVEDGPRNNSIAYNGKIESIHTSRSLPSLTNPFPKRVPASLLAAINERLGPDVHPDDTVVVEMSAENITSKMRHAFTIQELREVVSSYEEQIGRKVKPTPLETVMDPDDDGPITFEIRHGKERNIFKLPTGKLKGNKKWFLHYCLWPVGRYFLSVDEQQRFLVEDIRWEEVPLSSKAILMLPPDFWT